MSGGTTAQRTLVRALLDRYGRGYAADAGIRLADKPAPLYQVLVLASLLSARIAAGVAVDAARELYAAGCRTPRGMLAATWQDRVDALGRGGYRRYDERTATQLGTAAQQCRDRWRGDLRRLHAEGGGDRNRLQDLLTGFTGIGPTGAAIFLREAGPVWPDVGFVADRKVADGAGRLGLPVDRLPDLTPPADLPRLASALVRVALDRSAADDVRSHAAGR